MITRFKQGNLGGSLQNGSLGPLRIASMLNQTLVVVASFLMSHIPMWLFELFVLPISNWYICLAVRRVFAILLSNILYKQYMLLPECGEWGVWDSIVKLGAGACTCESKFTP